VRNSGVLLHAVGPDGGAGGAWPSCIECLCEGDRIAISINGLKVNECHDVFPTAGRIMLQTEGFEIFFRKFELHPLKAP